MKKKSERQKLIDKADSEMSRFIRLFHSDQNGTCQCVTCGVLKHWKGDGMHMGHFVPKGNGASKVRYIPHNTHPQCSGCNCSGGPYSTGHKQHIAPISYTQFMQNEYGEDFVDDLKSRKFQTVKYTNEDLIEIKLLYKEFADELEKKL